METKITITTEELVASARDLQINCEALLKVKLENNQFDASLTTLNRTLKQSLIQIGQLGDIATATTGEGLPKGFGEVRKYEKKSSASNEKELKEKKSLKFGEISNKPKVVSDEAVNKENQTFIDEIANMTEDKFKERYNAINNLKAVGKMINELEGEDAIKIGKGATVESLQKEIYSFLH